MFDPPGEVQKREKIRRDAANIAKEIDDMESLQAILDVQAADPTHRQRAFKKLDAARKDAEARDRLINAILEGKLPDNSYLILKFIAALCGYAHTKDGKVQKQISECFDLMEKHADKIVREAAATDRQSIGWLN